MKGYLRTTHRRISRPTLGKRWGCGRNFTDMAVDRGKEGILHAFLARTVEGNGLQQFSLGIRLINDLQHPSTRLALAITSSWVLHVTSPLDIF